MRFCRFVNLGTLLLSAGCGPGRGDLMGKVALEGRPVRVGTVQVLPADSIPRSALIEEGAYIFRNMPIGPVKVAVFSPDPWSQRIGARNEADRKKVEAAGAAQGDKWFPIPEKYASFEKSGLSCEVRSGGTSFDLALLP